jgi:hypothetical protein
MTSSTACHRVTGFRLFGSRSARAAREPRGGFSAIAIDPDNLHPPLPTRLQTVAQVILRQLRNKVLDMKE